MHIIDQKQGKCVKVNPADSSMNTFGLKRSARSSWRKYILFPNRAFALGRFIKDRSRYLLFDNNFKPLKISLASTKHLKKTFDTM